MRLDFVPGQPAGASTGTSPDMTDGGLSASASSAPLFRVSSASTETVPCSRGVGAGSETLWEDEMYFP